MGKLQQVTLLRMLQAMIQDEGFLESLADCITRIFDIAPRNSGTNDPFEIVVDRIIKYFETHTEIEKVEIPGIRSTLIGMFKEKQFLAFARTLRMLKDLNYTDARIINYLKQLKFRTEMNGESISPWIDVRSTAEAVVRELNPNRMRIFAGLSREERCLLQGFTSEQIAVLSKFSPRGIVILSKLGHLPPNQRSMILGLDQNERRLFQELGFDKILSLSRKEISGPKTLRKLIEREAEVIRSMNEEAGRLVGEMTDLTVVDRGRYLNLSPKEVDILNNLNEDHREVVSRFRNLEVVLNVAKNLHSSQRYLILSLRREDIHAALGTEYGEDFHQVQRLLRYSPMIIQRSYSLPVVEQHVVLSLNEQQRSVLARAYVLGHDGLFMIRQLGPELTQQVLNGKKELTVMQTALMKKLANLDFDKSILSQLFEIMEDKSKAKLLDLSWKGIQLLRKTAHLDEKMIGIVRRLSENGMEVLLNNDRMTGAEISMLGNLDGNEGKLLMNLDVKQRSYLSDQPDLTRPPPELFDPEELKKLRALSDDAELVLKRIVLLSDEEQRLLKGLQGMNTSVLNSMLPEGLNLLASLASDKLNLLTTFVFWRLGEEVIFKILKIPLGASNEEKIRRTRRILRRTPMTGSQVDHHIHIPLIAGAIEVLRLNRVITDDSIEEIIPMIEGPTLSLLFKVTLLKFSVRDSTSLVPQLTPQIEGTEQDIIIISRFNQIRTIEDLMFIRWVLSSSSTMNVKGLFEICRGSLINLSYSLDDGRKLEALLAESTSRVDGIEHETLIKNLKYMLCADRYLLSTFLFFAVGRKTNSQQAVMRVMKLFEKNMDADESFQFLNSPVYEGFLQRTRDDGLPNMLTDGRFPNPTILEVCLYHNRGNVLAMTEKLDGGQLWKLAETRPQLLLRMMTRNVQTDLIKLFGKVEKVEQVWKGNRVEMIQSVIGELTQLAPDFNPGMYLHIARGIRRLTYWPSFLGMDRYTTTITEYTRLVRGRVSRETFGDILDSFVSEDVSREYLEQRLEIPLRNRARISCDVLRKKREARMLCVDSKMTEDVPSKAKQRIVQSTFDDRQSRLYDELLDYSERKFRGEELDLQVQRDLMARIKDVPLDPRIEDIVATLDNPRNFDSIVKQSGMLRKIEKVAGSTGFVFTMFFVGKHIAHGDVEGLGYDALNLLILPKIGEKITEALEKSNPVVGFVLGTTVSNFAAHLGLVDGIIDRKNAVSEVDKEMADLNIVTNAVTIAANIPAVATQILEEFEVGIVVLGEFVGPVGVALTVPVVVGSYLIGVGLEVEKVTDHVQLSLWEKLSLYWEFFRDQPVPEEFVVDILAENMYKEYIANHLRRLNGSYDKIALSLPSFLIPLGYENTTFGLNFSHRVRAIYPFSTRHQTSRIVPENIEGYDFVCGPSTRDAIEKIVQQKVQELFIPSEPDDDCQNIVTFRKREFLNPSRAFFYVASDASIELSDADSLDIVFHGKNISIIAGGISVNRFYFQYQPDGCRIHKRGHNSFYVVGGRFECDLGDATEEQHNAVIIESDFSDSRGIHSIVGSEHREEIEANFAEFVDGSGGGDVIRATRNTIVKGYVNDLITGDCTVMLPFNVSEIGKLVAHTRMTVFNLDGSWIEMDGDARIMTADHYLLTPLRTSNITHRMVRAHIRKTFKHQIVIGEELSVLRNLTIPNCKLVKQITSANCDIVLSDLGQNVFSLDKNGHEYFWEAAGRSGNLYIFRKMFVKVTIANANGLLDFTELKADSAFERMDRRWSPEGEFKMSIGGLRVILLPEYGHVRITFDGKKYFELGESKLSRDWCSHSLPIVGRVLIDGTDLHNSYNCFEFQSDKIFFLRLQEDLLLVAGKQVLSISKYFSHLHGKIELSLKLRDGRIIEAPRFRDKADRAHRVVYYGVGSSGLQIYHNQPVDEHHIGYLDLGHQFIEDVEMRIDSGGLLLLYRNSTLVRIENWHNYEPARDMVFAFKDSFLPNAECIFSDCDPEDIIDEFKRSVTSGASRGSSWINVIINPIRNYYATLFLPGTPNKFNPNFLITSNINLVFLLLQNFLDRISPPVKLPTITTVETLSNVIDFIEEYRGTNDSFQLYSEIVELARNQRYDAIQHIIQQKSKQSHDEFNCHN